ncbi:MAG: family 16 glycosylhydrolase [Planctomycetota bacterium]
MKTAFSISRSAPNWISNVVLVLVFLSGGGVSSVTASDDLAGIEGIQAWFDASDDSSIVLDEDGRVEKWLDRSGNQRHAVATSSSRPKVVEVPAKGIRFTPDDVPSPLQINAVRSETGPVSVFVVARRDVSRGNRGQWQRMLATKQPKLNDHQGNGLAMTLLPDGGGEAFDSTVFTKDKLSVVGNPLTLGTTPPGQAGGGLLAEIHELIILDRVIEDHRQYEKIVDYLCSKWSANAPRGHSGWVRKGPIGSSVGVKTTSRPLFDQDGSVAWKRLDGMSDEFSGDQLNPEKWWDHNPAWHGRVPARFLPENIRVGDGMMTMFVRKDDTLPAEVLYPKSGNVYEGYSASSVVSKAATTYGCFEVRIKPADATCTSSFWFRGSAINESGVVRKTELDVFELPAGFEKAIYKFGMNMHVFEEPETDKHWSNHGNHYGDIEYRKGFHVVSFEWSPNWIRYYVDGHCLRTTRNTAFHQPLQMVFDMEIMSWLPFPDDSEFPAIYKIDYVRAWSRDDWKGEEGWKLRPAPDAETDITRAVRELTAKREQ